MHLAIISCFWRAREYFNLLLIQWELRAALMGFLADAAAVRRTVPSPNPSCSPIFVHDSPCERRAAILAASTVTRGHPRDFPFAFAFLRPARTLSTISERSNSATAPNTVKTIF